MIALEGQEDTQRSFTFVTSVGLYDANDNLLAVAKLSRPVEKNDEKERTLAWLGFSVLYG